VVKPAGEPKAEEKVEEPKAEEKVEEPKAEVEEAEEKPAPKTNLTETPEYKKRLAAIRAKKAAEKE
jgi:hypothetical protein